MVATLSRAVTRLLEQGISEDALMEVITIVTRNARHGENVSLAQAKNVVKAAINFHENNDPSSNGRTSRFERENTGSSPVGSSNWE